MEAVYSWQIKRLKYELAWGRQSVRQTLVYLSCILTIQIGLRALAQFIGEPPSLWDHIDTAAFFFLLITGAIYGFFANGGKTGRDFISRYIALAWVFGVRFAVMVELPLTFCFYGLPSLFIEMPVQTQWYDVLFSACLRLVFYFFLARHVSDVAHGRVPAQEELLDFRDKHAEDFDPAIYPLPLRRYISTLIDGALIFSACIILNYFFQGGVPIGAALPAAAILFCYEPVLTSRLCTLGQRITGIRVRTLESRGRISILNAFKRSAVKLLLGFISLFLIPATRKRRALHDFAAGTVVVYSKTMEE
jgi:uncharacterized RDD family membrane protein YckC